MSKLNAFGSAFKKTLEKLEAEYHAEIWQLRQEHASEIVQLRAEHQHQLTSLQLQAGNVQELSDGQAPEGSNPNLPDADTLATIMTYIANTADIVHTVPLEQSLSRIDEDDGVVLAEKADIFNNAVSPKSLFDDSDVFTPSVANSELKKAGQVWHHESSCILQSHVANHLEKNKADKAGKATAWLRKYGMARGWDISHTPMEKTTVQKVVSRPSFDTVCALAIILNTTLLGAVTTFRASTLGTEKLPSYYNVANTVFGSWFCIELMMRWIAEGLLGFLFISPNRSWNVFDTFVVTLDITEHVAEMITGGDNKTLESLSVMRMLRVLRIARALRVVRLLQFCSDLRRMVLSVFRSGVQLFWSMVLLAMVFYIFAIFLMQAVTEYLILRLPILGGSTLEFPRHSTEGKLQKDFGTLTMTFYKLFQTVSGGIDWGEITDNLSDVGPGATIGFCFFVFFTVFAFLNIMTGFFVETAFKSVRSDEEEVVKAEMTAENSVVKQLSQLFVEVDENDCGSITEEQFTTLVENPRAHALLRSMGLHVSEAKGLFALLDMDMTGSVSIDDFIIGCMRLRGGAQEMDLVSLMYENRKLLTSYQKMARYVKTEFERLDKFEDRVDECLNTLIQLSAVAGRHTKMAASPSPLRYEIRI